MRVGARITAATSALVALTLGAYALIDVRAGVNERRDSFEKTGRQLATALRSSLPTAQNG